MPMSEAIYKFEREMLRGESIDVRKKTDNNWYKKHWHNYFEIIYYKDCVGYCELNGVKHPISDSCLFFLTPKDFHEIVTEKRDGAYSLIISFSEQCIDRRLLDALTAKPIVLHSLSKPLEAEIEELFTVFSDVSPYRELHLKHLLSCILIRIIENGEPILSASRDIHPIVRESITYMLTNPAEHITLETLSEKFGISKTYFSHLFRNTAGVSFKEYLTSLRMECAEQMLSQKEPSVIDVGFECGFLTPSQFVRSFKKHTGMTPSEYRALKCDAVKKRR